MKAKLLFLILFGLHLILFKQVIINALQKDPRFVVLIASYNNKKWLKENLDSVLCQDYPYFRVVYVDDNSSDMTGEEVEKYLCEHEVTIDFTLIRNSERRFKVANFYNAIHQCDDEEIIVELDGDDFFYNATVLSTLAQVYTDEEVWMTYGQHINDAVYRRLKQTGKFTGIKSWKTKPVPQNIIEKNAFREYHWVTSHLRTYYAWLFKSIKLSDLIEHDAFYPVAGDIAMTFPMLEMAHFHSRYLPNIFYVWNNHSPLNDFRKRPGEQVFIEWKVRKKEKYMPLSASKTGYLKSLAHEKGQIIIISKDPQKLSRTLEALNKYVHDVEHITVIYDQNQPVFDAMQNEWSYVSFIPLSLNKSHHVQREIIKAADKVGHVVLMNDLVEPNKPIFLNKAIMVLEQTQTDFVLLHTNKREIVPHQRIKIFENVYAWDIKYMNFKDYFAEPCMMLYRTNDLQSAYLKSQSLDAGLHHPQNSSHLALIIDWSRESSCQGRA